MYFFVSHFENNWKSFSSLPPRSKILNIFLFIYLYHWPKYFPTKSTGGLTYPFLRSFNTERAVISYKVTNQSMLGSRSIILPCLPNDMLEWSCFINACFFRNKSGKTIFGKKASMQVCKYEYESIQFITFFSLQTTRRADLNFFWLKEQFTTTYLI